MAERRHFDVLVLGGGAAGCVLAARLSENPARSVGLVEAGPDYGAVADGRWPVDLLDAHQLPASHDWHYDEGTAWSARVMGGCSTHNACLLTWGADSDYDAWGHGWSALALEPYRRRAERALGARVREDGGAWHETVLRGAVEAGFPLVHDLNTTAPTGAARVLVNDRDGVRWNAALAYLDDARGRPNLSIIDRAIIDRVLLDGVRARGAEVIRAGEVQALMADRVVLAAGAYGSPAILLRSGIGGADQLARFAIDMRIDLPAVGRDLANHWTTRVAIEPGPELSNAIAHEAATAGVHAAGTVVKAASAGCGEGVWDLHLFTICWRLPEGEHLTRLHVGLLDPESRGSVTLASRDPEASPLIAHNAPADPAGRDALALADGLRLALGVLDTPAVHATGSRVAAPLDTSEEGLAAYAIEALGCYYHPVGTCAIGSVVDGHGAVHGAEELYVADASIMPTIPRANTHLSVLAVAERLAETLRCDWAGSGAERPSPVGEEHSDRDGTRGSDVDEQSRSARRGSER